MSAILSSDDAVGKRGLPNFAGRATIERMALPEDDDVWSRPAWIARAGLLLDSFRRRLGRELIERSGDAVEDARRLFEAPQVVVSHGTESDPILNYGNRAALDLWETDVVQFTQMPSRLTAEAPERDERARLLERTARDGYVDDYRGVRITSTGRRFLIEQAIVWNVDDDAGTKLGQAATFDRWTFLET
jgi:hypothetical protein